jgi:hypothetical protein
LSEIEASSEQSSPRIWKNCRWELNLYVVEEIDVPVEKEEAVGDSSDGRSAAQIPLTKKAKVIK